MEATPFLAGLALPALYFLVRRLIEQKDAGHDVDDKLTACGEELLRRGEGGAQNLKDPS